MEFDHILTSAMPILRETGEFDRQTEEILATLSFIENQQGGRQSREISVLCSSYIVTRCCAAAFSKSLGELEALETELPISLLPIVKEIRAISSSIKEKLEELKTTIEEIQTKARYIYLRKKITK